MKKFYVGKNLADSGLPSLEKRRQQVMYKFFREMLSYAAFLKRKTNQYDVPITELNVSFEDLLTQEEFNSFFSEPYLSERYNSRELEREIKKNYGEEYTFSFDQGRGIFKITEDNNEYSLLS